MKLIKIGRKSHPHTPKTQIWRCLTQKVAYSLLFAFCHFLLTISQLCAMVILLTVHKVSLEPFLGTKCKSRDKLLFLLPFLTVQRYWLGVKKPIIITMIIFDDKLYSTSPIYTFRSQISWSYVFNTNYWSLVPILSFYKPIWTKNL